MRKLFILLVLFFVAGSLLVLRVHADELDDINKQLQELQADLKNKESDHQKLATQLNGIKAQVAALDSAILIKEKEVRTGEKALGYQKQLLEARVNSYYKKLSQNTASLLNLLVSTNLSASIQSFLYQRYVADEDRRTIVKIISYVKDLQQKKTSLVREKAQMASIKDQIAKQTEQLAGEIAGAKQKIATLTSRQQDIIASKLASLNIPRSAGTSARGCSSDLTNGKNPGFSPAIAFFTYGAPHRNGMNQYGALGRAKAGQNEEQILSEYYPGKTLRKDFDQNIQISTNTGWSGSIEDYVKRIYEVPDSWTDNNLAVLKAQAVAARTYALNVTNKGSSQICTTESCQVFKPDPKGGNWEQAVNATAGWVLTEGDNPAFTQYASTHGGYIQNLGKFDGSGGNPGSFGELNERAYDRESPWFYCDWGARSEYDGTAWLKPNEVADILNVIQLAKYSDVDKEHLYQPDKSNPSGKETWNADKVKSELKSRGGNALDSVSDVSISVDFGSGKTTGVSGGGVSVGGDEFKNWFNLRAPANIQIVGPLFNVEKK